MCIHTTIDVFVCWECMGIQSNFATEWQAAEYGMTVAELNEWWEWVNDEKSIEVMVHITVAFYSPSVFCFAHSCTDNVSHTAI